VGTIFPSRAAEVDWIRSGGNAKTPWPGAKILTDAGKGDKPQKSKDRRGGASKSHDGILKYRAAAELSPGITGAAPLET
jgi:hypothetical protein